MLQTGQVLRGNISSYRLTRQISSRLRDAVWLAVDQTAERNVVVKYAENARVKHERDMIKRFQDRTPHIRPLLDEIAVDSEGKWPAVVLRWLDDDTLNTSITRQLSRIEIRRVARGVLEALAVLHGEGFVHTDVKPTNVLVNYDKADGQIAEVQLADLEHVAHQESDYAEKGGEIGAPIFRSTEVFLQMHWGTATDIWSFGAMMISLIYGGDFNLFRPDVDVAHEGYDLKVLIRHNQWFGPFPLSYQEIADENRLEVLAWAIENTNGLYAPFRDITNRELLEEDKQFLLKIMKLDPRERPTAQQLLADEWFLGLDAT